MMTLASPALPDLAVTLLPPAPPSPPTAVTFTALTALPVLPVWALDADCAPELAFDTALPTATALPVRPEFPLSPDSAAGLVTSALEWTSPVLPVEPESPEMATGLDTDVDDAGPVLPVLVADDWATAAPESPVMASGFTSTDTSPPLPPLADATAIESPPLTRAVTRSACAGGDVSTSRHMPPMRLPSTHSRDLRRIWFLPLGPDRCSLPRKRTLP